MWMRGGTSKGGYFLESDLPDDMAARDAFLLRVMGSPDKRQIDGMGGADPLTSKVAVVKKSTRPGIDVDYLFLQVFVDQAIVQTRLQPGSDAVHKIFPITRSPKTFRRRPGRTVLLQFGHHRAKGANVLLCLGVVLVQDGAIDPL